MIRAVAGICAALAATPAPVDDNELTTARRRPRVVDTSGKRVFALRWRRPIVRTGVYRAVGTSFGAPALSRVHDVVVVGSGEGVVRALARTSGTVVWQYEHGAPFESCAVVVDATVDANREPDELAVLGGRDGMLLALEVATGTLRWQTSLDGDPRAPVRRVGDQLLATTAKNKIFVLDLKSGEIRWSKGRPPPTGLTVDGLARAVEDNGVVYATYSDGYVEAYHLADGSTLWSRPLSIRGGEFVDADADPVIAHGRLFVASYSDGVFGLNPKDGQTAWHRPAPSVVQLAIADTLVIAASADGYVWGLTASSGDMVYRTRLAAGPMSRLVIRDGVVVTTAGENGLVVLDAHSGKPLQASSFGESFAGDPAWEADEVAFLAASGYVYALQQVAGKD